MRGIKKAVTGIALIGSFAMALLGQSSTAQAHIVLPSKVRAVRTPSKPPPPPPPIGISATVGTLTYLKSRHRDPVIIFEIKLSRAPGKAGVDVAYSTMGNNPTATTLFDNVSGEAIFHGTSVKYKVTVPLTGALGVTPGNFILMELSDPIDGVITNGQGVFGLVAKGRKR